MQQIGVSYDQDRRLKDGCRHFVIDCRVCFGLQHTSRIPNLKTQSMYSHIIYIVLSKTWVGWHSGLETTTTGTWI